jgi:hypothetical protein
MHSAWPPVIGRPVPSSFVWVGITASESDATIAHPDLARQLLAYARAVTASQLPTAAEQVMGGTAVTQPPGATALGPVATRRKARGAPGKRGGMADKEAERIKFETEMLKLTAAIATVAGGGSISLLLGNPPLERAILAVAGLLVTVATALHSGAHRAT